MAKRKRNRHRWIFLLLFFIIASLFFINLYTIVSETFGQLAILITTGSLMVLFLILGLIKKEFLLKILGI